jgi:hypothetical protein
MENKEVQMTIEEFTTQFDEFWEKDDEKGAVLFAQEHEEMYKEYCILEGLIDIEDEEV